MFEHERITRARRLSAEDRLRYHQQHSGPLLHALHTWLEQQFAEREVEPNSSLGKALHYLRAHWPELTQFLRVSGAPLDNNVVERALKLMIRQRKNSLFFATPYSANVASVLSSVIATAMRAGINVLAYRNCQNWLLELQPMLKAPESSPRLFTRAQRGCVILRPAAENAPVARRATLPRPSTAATGRSGALPPPRGRTVAPRRNRGSPGSDNSVA